MLRRGEWTAMRADAARPMTVPTSDHAIVYIASSAHSGSTLLNMLLNAHPNFVGLSEVDRLRTLDSAPPRVLAEMESDLWAGVRAEVEAQGHRLAGHDFGRRWNRYADVVLRRRTDPSELDRLIFAAVARRVSARWLVDASKSARRLANLLDTFPDRPITVVHLTRDGRAVMYSHRRLGYGPLRSVRNWMLEQLSLPLLRLATRRRQHVTWLSLRYEDLASATRDSVERVLAACGEHYDPAIERFWDAPFVGVGGNTMRFRKEAVHRDDRWMSELGLVDRLVFAVVAGWLNRLYGYGRARRRMPAGTGSART